MTASDPILASRFIRFSRLAGALSALVGAAVFLGWIFHLNALKNVFPGLATMKANTALAALLAGTALSFLLEGSRPRRRLVAGCAGLVTLIGLVTNVEYFAGIDLGIDELVFRDDLSTGIDMPPGRMAPMTAVLFVLVGIALLLAASASPRCHMLSQALALLVSLLALLALVGYVYGVRSLYQTFSFQSMALHTAATFLLLGIGTLAARPRVGFMVLVTGDTSGGALVRRLIPTLTLVLFCLGWLRLEGELAGWYDARFGVAIMVLSSIVVSTLIVSRVAWSSHRREKSHRETEDSLRESEERLRLAQQVAHIGTFEWNIQTGVNRWTTELEAMYGLPPGGFPGTQEAWVNLIHPDDRAEAVLQVKKAIESGGFEGEWRVVWADGTERWLSGRAFVFTDEAGKPLRLIGVNIDITERKRAERKFRLVVESAPYAMVMANRDGCIVLVNAEAEKLFGYSRQELLGQPVELLVPKRFRDKHPDQRAGFFAVPMARAMGVGRDLHGLRKDGSEFPVEIGLNPIETEEGLMVLSAVVDITERKEAEKRLRQSEERFRATFEQAAVGFAIVAPDGHWLRVNQKLCEMVGYTNEEMLERTFQDITHPADLRANLTLVGKLLAGELTTYSMEKRYFQKNGSIIWINLTVSLVHKPSGEANYFISVIEDISGRKRAEEEIHRLNAELEQRVIERTAELEAARQSLVDRVHDLQEALDQVKQLQGLLPICMYCKKIRDDQNYWHQVESYITKRTDALFSHGICPACYERVLEAEGLKPPT